MNFVRWLKWTKGRVAPLVGGHAHEWFRGCRIAEPSVEVFDCACGARRYVALGSGLKPDQVYDAIVNPGGSPANALNVVTGLKTGHFAAADTAALPSPLLMLNTGAP